MKVVMRVWLMSRSREHQTDRGFTLIELLIVIVIMGILAAVSLPSLINQGAKAKQTAAKIYVGTMNRAQQSYYLENFNFATELAMLQTGIPPESSYYSYEVEYDPSGGDLFVLSHGKSRRPDLRSYVGMVAILSTTNAQVVATPSILCESIQAGDTEAAPPTYNSQTAMVSCSPGTRLVGD